MKLLVLKYLDGQATKGEQAKLLHWLRNKENRIGFDRYKADWEKSLSKQRLDSCGEESWNQIQSQIFQKSFTSWQGNRKVNQFFKVAAIFFFMLSASGIAYFISDVVKKNESFTTVMAENGHISTVELPDGSLVWLNAGSQLTYSNYFASNNRDIKLSGEAYFNVERNEDIPFVVNGGDLQVKVLGTKFNVSAYPKNNKIKVVLESGKVELLNSEIETFSLALQPGELAIFDKIEHKVSVRRVNTAKFTSWKNGIMNIYDQSLEDLIKRLEIRYNQKFKISEEIKDLNYTFTIKNETLDETLHLMEKITPINIIQNQDIIEIEMDKNKQREVEK